jgi:hypothetical protein
MTKNNENTTRPKEKTSATQGVNPPATNLKQEKVEKQNGTLKGVMGISIRISPSTLCSFLQTQKTIKAFASTRKPHKTEMKTFKLSTLI